MKHEEVLIKRTKRDELIRQRDRSIPRRWFGPCSPVDPTVMKSLKKGCWQDTIPVSGEIARVAMPQEDFSFDFDEKAEARIRKAWKIWEEAE